MSFICKFHFGQKRVIWLQPLLHSATTSAGRLYSDACLPTLGAQFDKPEQNLVPLRLQLLDGARSDLGVNTVDELLLHFGRQFRLTKALPPGCHGASKLVKEVLDAAPDAGEMIEHHVAHDAPTQPRPPV